ncbi:MAG: WYL domain-containing protein [Phycisphaerales bacterium]
MISPFERRRRLIELCAATERTAEELARLLRVSRRTIAGDLKWMQERHIARLITRFDSRHRRFFRFDGAPPIALATPIVTLDHDELVALVAARGLLRLPTDGPAERTASPYPGFLDGALHRLLERSGALSAAAEIAPEAIQVFRFAARAEDPRILAEVVAATVRGDALRFTYTNRQGGTHAVHAAPRRLVLFRGEFHCFMWTPASAADANRGDVDPLTGRAGGASGRIKQYRVGRMRDIERTREQPRGCPASIEQWRIDRELAEAFETTGSTRDRDRHWVRLAVSPQALPHLEERQWGGEQRWTESAPDVPAGWRRLEFVTTGLEACRHWALGFGSSIRAEAPAELVRWLREEAMRVARALTPALASRRASGSRHKRDEPSARSHAGRTGSMRAGDSRSSAAESSAPRSSAPSRGRRSSSKPEPQSPASGRTRPRDSLRR